MMEERNSNQENISENVEKNKKNSDKKSSEFSLVKELKEWIYTIVIALLIAFVIKGFVFDVVAVDGPSMYPTLVDGDRLIVTKLGYKPKVGDIVILDSTYEKRNDYYADTASDQDKNTNIFHKVFHYATLPDNLKIKYYVKRVIATEGQTIDLKDGKVWIDGNILNEDYYDGITEISDTSVEYPITVKEGYVFVMGDNRSHSLDSRSSQLGQVPEKAVVGHSVFRLWPFNAIGLTK